jgi:hypothetical protein
MTTLIALFDVSPEGRSTAEADVAKSLALLGRDGVSPLLEKLFLMLADDIGYFEPMLGHLLRPSPSGR